MGFSCDLRRRSRFLYRAELGGGLAEHEYDHVFVGWHDAAPHPAPAEVAEWRWASLASVAHELTAHPHTFTPWFRLALQGLLDSPLWTPPAPRL